MSFTLHPLIETDSAFVRDLALCQVRLQNQSIVPWLVLIPRRAELTEMHQLDAADERQLMAEMMMASRAIEKLFAPDKINIGALGNVVPQLHVHVIGRFRSDPAWPGPVWGQLQPSPYAPQPLADFLKRLNDDALWRY